MTPLAATHPADVDFSKGIPLDSSPPGFMQAQPVTDPIDPYDAKLSAWRKENTESIYRDALKGPDLSADLSFAATPEEAHQLATNDRLLSLYLPEGQEVPIEPMPRAGVRAQVANRLFGQDAPDEAALFSLIQKDAQAKTDQGEIARTIAGNAIEAALTASPANWTQARDAIRTMPGYDSARDSDYLEAFLSIREQQAAQVEPIRLPLQSVFASMKSGNVEDVTHTALRAFDEIPPEHRQTFKDALRARIQALPDKERRSLGEKIAESFHRQIVGGFGSAALEAEGLTTKADTDTSSAIQAIASAVGGGGIYIAPLERRQEQDRQAAEFKAARVFAREMTDIFNSEVDPIKTSGILESSVVNAPGTIVNSLSMGIPVVGIPYMFGMMKGQAFDNMTRRFQEDGMSYEEAADAAGPLSYPAAIAQTALEKAQFGLWANKVPGLTKAINKLTDPITNKAGRLVARTAAVGIAETAIEAGQDATELAVQDIASALSEDIPTVDWAKEFDGAFARYSEVFLTMLPLAVLGGWGGLSNEARAAAFKKATADQRAALGIRPEDSKAIDQADGPSSLLSTVDQALKNADKNSPEAQAAAAREAERLDRLRQAEELDTGLDFRIPIITAQTDGTFTIKDPVTRETLATAPSPIGAIMVAKRFTAAFDEMRGDLFTRLSTELEAARTIAEEDATEIESDLSRLFTAEDAAALSPAAAERFALENERLDLIEGGSGNIPRVIFGYTTTEQRENHRQDVTKLFQGSNLATLYHERWHTLRRRAKETGAITREDDIALIRAFDQVLPEGQKLIKDPSLTDEQLTEADLDEAIAELGELATFLFPKGHKTNRHGLTRATVAKYIGAVGRIAPDATRKFSSFVRAIRDRLGLALTRAFQAKRAIDRGELDLGILDNYIERITGTADQRTHDAKVQELAQEKGLVDPDDIPFSLGRPTQTQESGASSDSAPLDEGNFLRNSSHVSIRAPEGAIDPRVKLPISRSDSFQSAPGEPDDLSPFGDGGDSISFSLGSARENYTAAKEKIPVLTKLLQQAESALRLSGGLPPYGGAWLPENKALRNQIESEYQRPQPGEPFPYNGRESTIDPTGERILPANDPVAWLDKKLITGKLIATLREQLAQAEADLYLAEQDFDPQSEARQQEADQAIEKELERKQNMYFAMLATRAAEEAQDAQSFVAKLWNTYAQHDEIFQYGKTTSQDENDIAAAVSSPRRKVTAENFGNSIRFTGQNGFIQIHDIDSDTPFIRAPDANSKGKKQGGGSQLYQAALDWIHNNGKRIRDDDAGLSEINWVRRTSNFFASAIRWGTTKHLKPHASQEVGKWTANESHNAAILAIKEMDNVHKAIPDSKGWTFEFRSGKFLSDGKPVSTTTLEKAVKDADPEESGIGLSTLRRGIITASAIQEFQQGTTADVLSNAVSPGPELASVSYSLGRPAVADSLALSASRMGRDPLRRVRILKRISNEFSRLAQSFRQTELEHGIPKNKAQLKREARVREEMIYEEKVGDIHARFGSLLADEDLVKIRSQPVHDAIASPGTHLRGSLMSRSQFIKHHPDRAMAGEYDGSEGISRTMFGGTQTPDQVARQLHLEGIIPGPTPGDLWDALAKEANTVASLKEMLQKATDQMRQAKVDAKKEANDWLATQSKKQSTQFSERQQILAHLRLLDAILLALPQEVRGKIGGHTQAALISSKNTKGLLSFLRHKLDNADKELEIFLKKEYGDEMADLLRRAAPQNNKAGQRPTGSIDPDAYRILTHAQRFMDATFQEADAEANKLDALADDPETDSAEADRLRATAAMVRLMGAWDKAPADRRESAVTEATKIYLRGLSHLNIKRSQRNARLAKLRRSASASLKNAGHRMDRERAKTAQDTRFGALKDLGLAMLSYGQIANVLFGEKSAIAKFLNRGELAASNAYQDAYQEHLDAVETFFHDLANGKPLQAEKIRHRMQHEVTIKVQDALGMDHEFTDMQAITYLLMWRQKDGKRHMEGYGDENANAITSEWAWSEASIAAIREQLSPEGKQFMEFLSNRYAAEYPRINAVFERIWNVPLPQNKNYSPLSVRPANDGDANSAIIDPTTGQGMGYGMTPGSLKNRSMTAIAEPEAVDALTAYLQHSRQMEHFIAYAEFARDARTIVQRRDVSNRIKAVSPEAGSKLNKWLEYFSLGGLRANTSSGREFALIQRSLSRLSSAILVGRVSVLAVQSLQLGAGLYKMPVGAYLMRLAKLKAGRLNWGDAIRSPYIQRRIKEMPPIVRDALDGLKSGKPSQIRYRAAQLSKLIPGADGLFTAGTYAILLDYHRSQAIKQGKSEQEADRYAHEMAELDADQIAQPVRPGARSWVEVSQQASPAFRVLFNFASDPRQKIAIPIYELLRRDKAGFQKALGALRSAAVTWTVSGIVQSLLRAALRDIRNDEDDEVFDERNWSLKMLAIQSFLGPLGGIPFAGPPIEAATYQLAGYWGWGGGTILDTVPDSIDAAKDLAMLESDDIPRDLETLFTGAAMVSPVAAALTPATHILRDSLNLIQNAEGPDPED